MKRLKGIMTLLAALLVSACGGGGGIAADFVDMTEALDAVTRIGESMQEFLAELHVRGDLELVWALDGGAGQAVSTLSVGRIPPQPHPGSTTFSGVAIRSMRIPLACLPAVNEEVELQSVNSICVQQGFDRSFGLDDLSLQRRGALRQ